jgi:hypothetical protein
LRENFNSNIDAALSRLSRIAKEDKDYFGQKVEEIIAEPAVFKGSGVSISAEALSGAHPALRHRIVVKLFESIGLSKDITASHLEQADRLLKEAKTSSAIDFTAGYAMRISYDVAEFYKKEQPQSLNFEYEINMDGITEIPELNAGIGL